MSLPMAKPTQPAAGAAPEPADDPLAALLQPPRVVGASAGPLIAEGHLASGELGHQHRASVVQAADDGGVLVDDLAPAAAHPHRVGAPRAAMMSFTPYGMPCRTPR